MTKQSVSGFFDVYARDFNAIYGTRNTPWSNLINKLFRQSMRKRFEMTLTACDPVAGRSVLDIGTGPGHYAITLAQRGAGRVLGLDFAQGMIEVARRNAEQAGVADRCTWTFGDFTTFQTDETFDYCIVMGFMDYIEKPREVIDKVLSLTNRRAMFSFPVDGGLLAWQRKRRYRKRCELYMYTEQQVRDLFAHQTEFDVRIDRIGRDFFVMAERKNSK